MRSHNTNKLEFKQARVRTDRKNKARKQASKQIKIKLYFSLLLVVDSLGVGAPFMGCV